MTKDTQNKNLRQIDPMEQAPSNDFIGNFALLATAMIKAAQFFTREGDNKSNLRGSTKDSPEESINSSHEPIIYAPNSSNTSENLLPSELAKIINSTPEELKKMANLSSPEEYIKFKEVVNTLHESFNEIKETQAPSKTNSNKKKNLGKNLGKKIKRAFNKPLKRAKKNHREL